MEWLVGKGIDARRLTPLGCGSVWPLTFSVNEREREQNRPAELVRRTTLATCELPGNCGVSGRTKLDRELRVAGTLARPLRKACHNGKGPMTAAGNTLLRRFSFRPTPEKRIREWKAKWRQGAENGWAGASPATNPFPAASLHHSAWAAGCNWARNHPDRRREVASGLAHPHRRANDTITRLFRRASLGPVGLSALTVMGAVWTIRRRRTRG